MLPQRLDAADNIIVDGRGSPLSNVQQLCIALCHWGGANLHRVSAYCGDVSYNAAWNAVNRVRDALVAIAPQHITLPTEGEMAPTADRMYRKHGLPNFAYAVDGTHFRFDGVVKDIPIGPGKWWAS